MYSKLFFGGVFWLMKYRVCARNIKIWFHLLKGLKILKKKERKRRKKEMRNDYKNVITNTRNKSKAVNWIQKLQAPRATIKLFQAS